MCVFCILLAELFLSMHFFSIPQKCSWSPRAGRSTWCLRHVSSTLSPRSHQSYRAWAAHQASQYTSELWCRKKRQLLSNTMFLKFTEILKYLNLKLLNELKYNKKTTTFKTLMCQYNDLYSYNIIIYIFIIFLIILD